MYDRWLILLILIFKQTKNRLGRTAIGTTSKSCRSCSKGRVFETCSWCIWCVKGQDLACHKKSWWERNWPVPGSSASWDKSSRMEKRRSFSVSYLLKASRIGFPPAWIPISWGQLPVIWHSKTINVSLKVETQINTLEKIVCLASKSRRHSELSSYPDPRSHQPRKGNSFQQTNVHTFFSKLERLYEKHALTPASNLQPGWNGSIYKPQTTSHKKSLLNRRRNK